MVQIPSYLAAQLVKHDLLRNTPAHTRLEAGRVAEWLKAPVLKTGVLERVSGVRIPPLQRPKTSRQFSIPSKASYFPGFTSKNVLWCHAFHRLRLCKRGRAYIDIPARLSPKSLSSLRGLAISWRPPFGNRNPGSGWCDLPPTIGLINYLCMEHAKPPLRRGLFLASRRFAPSTDLSNRHSFSS
jgi:hypothetical protein